MSNEQQKGISSAQLVGSGAMGDGHRVDHAAAIGAGGQGLNSAINQDGSPVDNILGASKIGNLGEGASIDHITKLIGGEGALESNPFEAGFSGNNSPFNIGHDGWNMKVIGDMDLSKLGPKEQFSAGPGLPGIASSAAQNQH